MEITINLPDELIEQVRPFLKEGNFEVALSESIQVALNEYLGLRTPLPVEFAERSPEDAKEDAAPQETNASTPNTPPAD